MLYAVKRFFKIYSYPFLLVFVAFLVYYILFIVIQGNGKKTESDPYTLVDDNTTPQETLITQNETNKSALIGNVLVDIPTEDSHKPKVIEFYTPHISPITLYEEPNAQSSQIATITDNDVLQKIGTENEWILVDSAAKKLQGWTRISNLTKTDKKTTERFYTTSVSSLNLRAGRGTEYRIIGELKQNQIAKGLEENDGWIYLEIGGVKGWGIKQYLKETSPTQNNAQDLTKTRDYKNYYYSIVPSLNIRLSPVDGAVIGKLRPQHKAIILQQNGEWVEIERLPSTQEKGIKGWVVKRSIKPIS